MGLELRVLVSDFDQVLSIAAVMGHLNRDENRNYHHHNFERAVTSVFHNSLLPYLSHADFDATWSDLGRLLRTAVTNKLSGFDGQLLDKYCSHANYVELEKLASAKVLGIVENEFEGERGKQMIVAETWKYICARLFSHVHDVLTGKLDLRICARGKGYCHDLYLIEKNPGKPQKYCGIKCRDAESQRQVRARRKAERQQEEIRF